MYIHHRSSNMFLRRQSIRYTILSGCRRECLHMSMPHGSCTGVCASKLHLTVMIVFEPTKSGVVSC